MPATHKPAPFSRDATLVAGRKDLRNSVATDANRSRKPKKGESSSRALSPFLLCQGLAF